MGLQPHAEFQKIMSQSHENFRKEVQKDRQTLIHRNFPATARGPISVITQYKSLYIYKKWSTFSLQTFQDSANVAIYQHQSCIIFKMNILLNMMINNVMENEILDFWFRSFYRRRCNLAKLSDILGVIKTNSNGLI